MSIIPFPDRRQRFGTAAMVHKDPNPGPMPRAPIHPMAEYAELARLEQTIRTLHRAMKWLLAASLLITLGGGAGMVAVHLGKWITLTWN